MAGFYPRLAAVRQPVPFSRLHAHARGPLRGERRRGRRPAGRAPLRKLLSSVCGGCGVICKAATSGRGVASGVVVNELIPREGVVSEAAVLVGVFLPDRESPDIKLEELEGLAATAGVRVVGRLTQRRSTPDATTYLGHGKVEELKTLAAATDADLVIFDNDLSPGQTRNLEKAIGLKVLDRTELILDIFASRAQTAQARLGGRTGATRIRHAAAEADVDAPFAAEERRRPARAGRNPIGRRPPAGREHASRTCGGSWTPSSAASSARSPPAAT